MTNTPERYDHHEDGMEIARDGDFVSYDDYAALLVRAEQAEARVAKLEEAGRLAAQELRVADQRVEEVFKVQLAILAGKTILMDFGDLLDMKEPKP
jgi:hypothetical protein